MVERQDMSRIKIINFFSISYSGTTWINLILSSHPKAFMVGPPDRIWKLPKEEAAHACLIHESHCHFWPEFLIQRRESGRFFERLAEYSGKDTFIINNPTRHFISTEMESPILDICTLTVWRDPRGVLASALRHQPERFRNVKEAVEKWLLPGLRNVRNRARRFNPDAPALRYEEMVRCPESLLKKAGDYVGLSYNLDSLRYWECEHHLTAGNTGSLDVLRRLQGVAGFSHTRSQFYQKIAQQARQDAYHPVLDDTWKTVLTAEDLKAYYDLVGEFAELQEQA